MELLYKIVFFIFIFHCANSASFTSMENLYTYLTSGHNKYIRPESDLTTTTEITIDFYIVTLQDINEMDGTVSVTGYFVVQWTDQNLKWDPTNYDNAANIMLPVSEVWTPSLINANTAKEFKIIGTSPYHINVNNDGIVTWSPGENLEFTCDIDISYFPFDTQKCYLKIAWFGGYVFGDLNFTSTYSEVPIDGYSKNGEWDLIKSSTTYDQSMVTFSISFKRRPLFLVINLILPVVFLAALNICVFWLPQESGERIGFSITLLLAVVVFLTIAQGMLPATSEPRLSDICIMLIIDLLMSGMIIVSVIVSTVLYYKSEDVKIPSWIEKIVRLSLSRYKAKQNKIADEHLFVKRERNNEERASQTENEDKINGDHKITWQDVSKVWDNLSLIFYILMIIVGVTTFVVDIAMGIN